MNSPSRRAGVGEGFSEDSEPGDFQDRADNRMAQQDFSMTEIARVYASALFDAAVQANRLPEVTADMEALAAVLARLPRFAVLLHAATISTAEKYAVLERVFGAGLEPLTRQAFSAMARRDRLELLPEWVRVFQEVRRQRMDGLTLELTTAAPLDDARRVKITRQAAAALKRPIDLQARLNPQLLAGAQWRIGDRFCDGSLRGKLEAMRRQLRQNSSNDLRPDAAVADTNLG